MQFQQKVMTQIQENGEKLPGRQFFSKIWLCQSLDIMVSYRHVRY